jgi:hypothetical protein
VAVGRQRDRAGRLEQDPALEVHRRHTALPEEVHAAGIEAEVAVLRKEDLGRRVVLMAGHDEPVQRPAVAAPRRQYFLGEDPEKRLAPDRVSPERSPWGHQSPRRVPCPPATVKAATRPALRASSPTARALAHATGSPPDSGLAS